MRLAFSAVAFTLMFASADAKILPGFTPSQEQLTAAKEAMQRPEPKPRETYPPHLADGSFMGWSDLTHFYSNPIFKLDDDGLPTVEYYGEFQYNPVTMAQFGLHVHALWLQDKRELSEIEKVANRLVAMQGFDGAFRYAFEYKHHSIPKPFAPGWTSAMANGNAMSFFARAYAATKNDAYLQAGTEALDFLAHDTRRGVHTDLSSLTPEGSSYAFFDEYPGEPRTFTLNGFMFVLLGLYDWSEVTGSETARDIFERGLATLEAIIHLYDFEHAVAYDLSHLTIDGAAPIFVNGYHPIHIDLMEGLAEISGSEYLGEIALRWATMKTVSP